MPTNEIEVFVRSIVAGLSAPNTNLNYPPSAGVVSPNASEGANQLVASLTRGMVTDNASDAGSLAAEVQQLRKALTDSTATTEQANRVMSGAAESTKSSSTVETVLKTIGLVSGVGPIAAGLMSLFGSRTPETSFSAIPYDSPSPIAIQAGLGADRQFTAISYAADGSPRAATSGTRGSNGNAATPPIQINVQAMDSRSFLDHSDDIARAVREAMLHSHSLNDIVSEL